MEIILIIFTVIWIWGIYEWWKAPLYPDDYDYDNDEWKHERRMTEYKDETYDEPQM